MKPQAVLVLLAALAILTAVVIWSSPDRSVPILDSRQPAGRSAPRGSTVSRAPEDHTSETRVAGADEDKPRLLAASAAGSAAGDAPLPDANRQVADPLLDLRSAIDASVFGRIDLATVFDVAEGMLELDVDPLVNLEPDPLGDLRFSILGTPEGLSAQLVVLNSHKYADVLSLEMQIEGLGKPYLLDGTPRAESNVTITAWFDDEGSPQSLSVLTNVLPHYKQMHDDGIDFFAGQVLVGMTYRLDLLGLQYPRMTAHGFVDGAPKQWELQPVVDGEAVYPERMRSFGHKLLNNYNRLKHSSTR